MLAGVLLAGAGFAVPGLEQFVLPFNLLLISAFLITGRIARQWDVLEFRRVTDPVLSVRVPNTVRLALKGSSPHPLMVRIRDEVDETFGVSGNEFQTQIRPDFESEHAYTVVPQYRGQWSFRGLFVEYVAPFGLARVRKQIGEQQPVRVYPNVKAVREFELLKQAGHLSLMGLRKSRLKGLGTEFESLREYNEDDYRTIDWKASARRGKLVVKNFEQESNQAVMICVDVGRHMLGEIDGVRKLDYCLDAALLLMHAAQRAGDMVGLLHFNDSIKRYLEPKKGKAQIAALLDAIYDTEPEPVQPHYSAAFAYLSSRWKRRSLIVVFTDAENFDQGQALSQSLGRMRQRHIVLVVRVKDPKLKTLVGQPITNEERLFGQAAARWYESDRRKAESVLRNAGIQSIEAEPQDLANELVGAYLRVKQLNLL